MIKRATRLSAIFVIALTAVFSFCAPLARADIKYTVTGLGVLPGASNSEAAGINNEGQVVGYSLFYTGTGFLEYNTLAFLYSGGQLQNLGTLPDSIYTGTIASAINNAGQVVGYACNHVPDLGTNAFLYSGGNLVDLGSLGNGLAAATDINTAGQIVGYSSLPNHMVNHAFLYSGGQMQDIGTLGGTGYHDYSSATGINDSGQVVGSSNTATSGSNTHAFLYGNGQMLDLGTLGGASSSASAINNAGQIVGFSTTGTAQHAFLYTGGKMLDLGTIGGGASQAAGINNVGQVVGDFYTGVGQNTSAFLYSGGTMTDLNTLIDPSSGWTLEKANAINDVGQIVGYGYNSAGQQEAFLLSLLGDFNHDGVVNASDLDQLYANFTAKTGTFNTLYDANSDGVVNQADVDYVLQNVLHCSYADADLNGKVDFLDFQVLLDHWQRTGQGWTCGDWNGDGVVDFLDFQALLDNWNPDGIQTAQTPEPATLSLLLLGALGLARRRKNN